MRALSALALVAAAAATATITVNTTTIDHLGTVRVTYSGLTATQAKWAWIGVYDAAADTSRIAALPYPATSPWTAATPIKYIELYYMNQTAGYGHWDFTLLNMFVDVKFVLFTGGPDYPTAVAKSATVTFTNPAAPLRGHLGPTGNPTEMRITWNGRDATETPVVQWGTSSGNYPNSAPALTSTYSRSDMCGAPANTDFGWFEPFQWHSAVMTGLTPGATYYYTYGSAENGMSAEFTFRAMNAPSPTRPLAWCVFADIGVTDFDDTQDHWDEPDAWTTMSHMIDAAAAGNCNTAALVGDVAYATGMLSKWPLFDERIHVLARSVPMLVGHGNHERDWTGSGSTCFQNSVDSGGECGVPVSTRYPMPWAGSSAANPNNGTWFTVTEGPLTWIMLNSELPLNATFSAQYKYLAATLAAVNRSVTPWLIVAFHRPMYYDGLQDPNFAQVEDLLMQYKVDLVLTGHVHNAQVTCPIYQNACVTPAAPGAYDAPIHVVLGNAGQTVTPLVTPQPDTVVFQGAYHGYSTLAIASPTSLTLNFYADSDNSLQYALNVDRAFPRV